MRLSTVVMLLLVAFLATFDTAGAQGIRPTEKDRLEEPQTILGLEDAIHTSFAVGNITEAETPEIVVALTRAGKTQVLMLIPALGYRTVQFEPTFSCTTNATVGIGDYDSNGQNDIALVCESNIQVFWMDGSKSTTSSSLFSMEADTVAFGNGVIAITPSPKQMIAKVTFLRFNSERKLVIQQRFGHDAGFNRVVIGDINADGNEDTVVAWGQGINPILTVYYGLADGTFDEPVDFGRYGEDYGTPKSLKLQDVSSPGPGESSVQDGKLDVLVAYDTGVRVYVTDADGTLQGKWYHSTPSGVQHMAFVDMNCTGDKELVLTTRPYLSWLEFGEDSEAWYRDNIGPMPTHSNQDELIVGDFDGNGQEDFLYRGDDGMRVTLQRSCGGTGPRPYPQPARGQVLLPVAYR